MLKINPAKRISASDALKHPYFDFNNWCHLLFCLCEFDDILSDKYKESLCIKRKLQIKINNFS